ncbi:MAG: hypothetical protein GY810_17930 [Aureispira sp.]|nr:hypothetical protein [Aureispira sp.]
MSQKLHLFKLIKSLSPSEKGYFKKYYANYSTNQIYVQLFDAIDEQTKYDENSLKKQFEAYKLTKQFSVAKNYLIKNILKSLRAYHSDASRDITLNELLTNIELLYKKRLIGLCRKTLKRAKKLVLAGELFHKYSEIALWEIRLENLIAHSVQQKEKLNNIYQFALEGIERNENLMNYRQVAFQFNALSKEGAPRTPEAQTNFKQFIEHPLLQSELIPKSETAKGFFYNLQTKISEITYDFEGAFENSKKFIEIIENNPNIYSSNPSHNLIPAYYNLLGSCIYLKNNQDFAKNLEKFKNIPKTYKSNDIVTQIITLLSSYLELANDVNTVQFERAIKQVPLLKQILKDSTHIGFLSVMASMQYHIAYAYFGTTRFDDALDWINTIIQKEGFEVREDLTAYAWLLNLIIHYELDNLKHLEYKLKATHKFISKLKKDHDLEKTVLKFISELLATNSEKSKKEVLKKYHHIFLELEKQPYERMALISFDIISWIESKLNNKSFAETIKLRRQL